MARSLRTAAVLSFCAILVPTGCDSPTSSPELQPSAAVVADGTVVITTRLLTPTMAPSSSRSTTSSTSTRPRLLRFL